MNNQLHIEVRVVVLRWAALQFGCGLSAVWMSILFCFMCQPVSADVLVASGDNGHGQLGNGATTSTNRLSPVSGLGAIFAEGSGGSSAFAIQSGALYAWGYNADGELGDGTTNEAHMPTPMSGLSSGVTAVTGGLRHALALRNGSVYAWGYNGTGELGIGTFDYERHTIPAPVIGLSGVNAIAAGDYHSLALQNGAVYAWGWNDVGELGSSGSAMESVPVPVTGMSSGVTAIAAGSFSNLAIKEGAVWGWGANSYGQLGTGAGTRAEWTPVQVTNMNAGVTAIAAGYQHGLAVMNGVVYAWGRNYYGELGNGGWSSVYIPVMVAGLPSNIVAVAAGYGSSYALSANGRLWVWGNGLSGQLGTGANFCYNTPQEVLAPYGYRFMSINADAGGSYAMARLALASEPTVVLSISWSNGAPRLSVVGAVGERCALERVSTLAPNNTWLRLATNILTSQPWIVTDTNAAATATRFYRAVRVP